MPSPEQMASSFFVFCLAVAVGSEGSVYTTYHWHMQQPIYWPAVLPSDHQTYQKAYDSLSLQSQQGGHPKSDIDGIFGKADRISDYQHYALDAVLSCSQYPDMGAQVSFSGCLIENLNNLASHNHIYAPEWNSTYSKAINTLKTSSGLPKLDFVAFTYHHVIASLVDQNALDKEIGIQQLMYAKTWNGAPYSKGFFPAEMVFTERAIPTLVKHGIEWVIVANHHLSRACKGYPYSPHGDNNSPPNMADQVNPPQANYFRRAISVGCSPSEAYPFAFQPHYVQHVDPNTGSVTKLIVVPAAMAMSWADGYQCYSTSDIDQIANSSSPEHPLLVLLAHDGDNAFGGGYTYYEQCVSSFVKEAEAKGYQATTIQQYLSDHPVDPSDVVHVEDGGWVNPAGDFGSPQSLQWNYPLLPKDPKGPGDFDIETGWSLNERNWAILTAAENAVETAEQVSGGVRLAEIQDPSANATEAELAWHFFLPGLTSGYMYYGNAGDMPVKQTVACNLAIKHASASIAKHSDVDDTTPPTIWTPQHLPWNPGACGMGELWGYKYTPMTTDFYIWTFVHDMSEVATVEFHYRVDNDGENPIHDTANEVYACDHKFVKDWVSAKMIERIFPKGNYYNMSIDLTCDSSGQECLPETIANEYWTKVTGLKSMLIDYYISAVDTKGNVKKSDIYHVYIGNGTAQCSGAGHFKGH